MPTHPLKSGRIPFEVLCRGHRIQIIASGHHLLSFRLLEDPQDGGAFERALTLPDCRQSSLVHPPCYKAFRINEPVWHWIRNIMIQMGCDVGHWFPPSDFGVIPPKDGTGL